MRKCYFCGADAPELKKEKGKYILECTCGMSIADSNRDMVLDLWNYEPQDEKV